LSQALVVAGVLALAAFLAAVAAVALRRLSSQRRLVAVEAAEHEEARAALDAAEARYRGVFNTVTEGLLIVDSEGTIQEANPAACTILGRDLGELFGEPLAQLWAPGHENTPAELTRQIDQQGSARVDSVLRRIDGASLDVEVRGARITLEGHPSLLVILTDMSGRAGAVHHHAMLSRKVLMAQEEERARLSRELHDELGQVLTALRFELDFLHRKGGGLPEETAAGFVKALGMVEDAADELRRICRGLRPPLLDDLGLVPAVQTMVEEFEAHTQIPVALELRFPGDLRVPPEVALCTYRVVQESLNNACRHSGAREMRVVLEREVNCLLLMVYDDGKGFAQAKAASAGGGGLAGMRERAHLAGGTLELRSEPMQGTRITLRVPLPEISELEES